MRIQHGGMRRATMAKQMRNFFHGAFAKQIGRQMNPFAAREINIYNVFWGALVLSHKTTQL
jgi:hypothetical protein